MKKILFQPFNFEKWLIIGFAAFLSGHFAGMGFNFPVGNFPPRHRNQDLVYPHLEQWKPWLPIAIVVAAAMFLALTVVLTWLKARGNFIFTDCIARNRAAIVDPWREYRREGNSYFLFLLAVVLGSIALFGSLCLFGFVGFGIFHQGSSGMPMTPMFIVFLVLFFMLWLSFVFFFGLTSYFMVPVMYVRRCLAVEAFREVAGLILENVGTFILFCLFGICLLLAVAVIGAVATCATCCLASLPYVGTVILLPAFVCLRAFGLCFVRQFGSDYDVWAGIPQDPLPLQYPPPPLPS